MSCEPLFAPGHAGLVCCVLVQAAASATTLKWRSQTVASVSCEWTAVVDFGEGEQSESVEMLSAGDRVFGVTGQEPRPPTP